jgi:hypothetical protein
MCLGCRICKKGSLGFDGGYDALLVGEERKSKDHWLFDLSSFHDNYWLILGVGWNWFLGAYGCCVSVGLRERKRTNSASFCRENEMNGLGSIEYK